MDPNKEKTLVIKGRFGLVWADWECAIPAWLVEGFGVFEAQPASRRLQRRTQTGKLTIEDRLVLGSACAGTASAGRRVSVTTGRGGQHVHAFRDDALDGLSGFRVLDKGRVFDALPDLVAFGFRAFLHGNGFVNVSGHAEVMSDR
jgi:hypothetical protein